MERADASMVDVKWFGQCILELDKQLSVKGEQLNI